MLTPPPPPQPSEPLRPAVYSAHISPSSPPPVLTAVEQAQQDIQALPLTHVLNHAQLLGKLLYAQGDLSYLEAVNKETLRNSYSQFSTYPNPLISILPASKDGKVPARVRLNREWLPRRTAEGKLEAKGLLWDFCERVSWGRREGKNRRDGGTVRGRVLEHVRVVGERLWEVDAGAGATRDGRKKRAKAGSGHASADIQAQGRARQDVLAKL